jgi:ornithine cyclodeaminase/alanine dehydrogenase-like protein (mu-crystallin family)
MAVLLNQEDIAGLLQMSDCIDVIERGFADYANGKSNIPSRIKLSVPTGGDGYFMPGSLNTDDAAFGIKIVTEFPANKLIGLQSIYGLVVLLDTETGQALSIMDGRYITNIRTGAASAVAAKYLAREDARTVGVLGFGEQAFAQVVAMAAVRRLSSVRIYSPSAAEKRNRAKLFSDSIGVPVEIAESAQAACTDSDIIVLATNHTGEVINGDWVKPGTFVNAVGFHTKISAELDAKALSKADVIVCDERAAAIRDSGDIIAALASGVIDEDQLINLGDIVIGKEKGRARPDQITIYRSLGNAFQDLATASFVYRQAVARGIGTEFNF